jgi:hypothetical protein
MKLSELPLTINQIVLIGIPIAFYLCGGIGKILTRPGSHFWDRKDWYLAADASLANVASGLLFIGELVVEGSKHGFPAEEMVKALPGVVFVAMSLFFYILILAAHQKIEHDPAKSTAQLTVLVGGCNLVAILVMYGFISLVKGV